MQGTIKRIVREKGFGFILSSDGKEVFFHRTGLQQIAFEGLQEGTSVDFEVEQSEKGPRATNVRPIAG
jgi:CspA family cold shock protein